jgi:hypothetical protein
MAGKPAKHRNHCATLAPSAAFAHPKEARHEQPKHWP